MFCFRCGAPLELVDDELRCIKGEMGLSKKLQELLEAEITKSTSKPNSNWSSNSKFRCPLCATPLSSDGHRSLQCSECGLLLTPQITHQMVERHSHLEDVPSFDMDLKNNYHCWRCAKAFKPTSASGFFGPYYCSECLKNHPELFENQQSKKPSFEPEITAMLRLFLPSEGGRKGPSFKQIRSPMKIEGKEDAYHDCVVLLPEGRAIHPGESFIADIQFLCPELVAEWLKEGMNFKLWELRFFAEGQVLSVAKKDKQG